MTKLNQMIAVRKGLRVRAERDVTDIYHQFQKPALYAGLSRTYQPRDDEGERLPSERQIVQRKVEDDLQLTAAYLTKLMDVVATVDYANQSAVAPVVVDGLEVVPPAPVSFLLFLEKQLTDLRTQVSKAPTLDPEKVWEADHNNGGYRAESVVTTRARKIPTVLELAPATDKHPRQTQVFQRDEIVGDWTLTIFSGAISAERKRQILDRIEKTLDAVKTAVEAANATDVEQQQVGEGLFEYLLTP